MNIARRQGHPLRRPHVVHGRFQQLERLHHLGPQRLAGGDEAILQIEGVGTKALADTKKALRRLGYELPTGEAEAEKAS